MKRAKIFAMAAMLAFGFASCSNEGSEIVDPNVDGAGISFTFNKPVGAYAQTYADIATTPEWAINTLEAYVFNTADNSFAGKLTASDYTSSVNATTHTTTVTMTQAWVNGNLGKTFRFYFVANDAGSTNGAHIDASFAGNEDAFKALLTNPLTDADVNGKFDNIATPLLFSGVSTPIAVTGNKVTQTLDIKRRVARFDIVNELTTRFVIKEVLISDARKQGYIWADAGAGADITTLAKVSMEPINVTALTPVTESGIDTYEAAFYTYPTSLDVTTFAVIADLDGTGEKVYGVNSSIAIEAIEANKRYKLNCKPSDEGVVIDVVAADWEEGTGVDVTPKTEAGVALGTISYPNLYDNTFFYVNDNTGTEVTIPVTSSTGTYAEVTFVSGVGSAVTFDPAFDAAAVETGKTTTFTYATFTTTETYKFNLPTTETDGDGPFDIQVRFISKADATKSVSVRLVRTLPTVAVENILAYDDVAGLNLDGVGTPLYFKYGSLVGIDATRNTFDVFDAEDVLWAPSDYLLGVDGLKADIGALTSTAAWAKVPFADQTNYLAGVPTDQTELDAANALGVGDPCRYATKAGAGEGTYKTPGGNPYNGSSATGTWGMSNDMMGRTINGQFYPAAGHRSATTGLVYNVGRSGLFWSSTPHGPTASNAYTLYVDSSGANPSNSNNRASGFLVRCISE